MNITIQPTGYPVVTFEADSVHEATEMLDGDKRGVRVTIYQRRKFVSAAVVYLSTWGNERPFTRVTKTHTKLEDLAAEVREMAKSTLPPGAGFPATPSFETRQAKLAGMMETLTLTALSRALEQAC